MVSPYQYNVFLGEVSSLSSEKCTVLHSESAESRFIVRDAEFDPGNASPGVWHATHESPHVICSFCLDVEKTDTPHLLRQKSNRIM